MEMINLQLQIFLLLAIGYGLGKSGMISKSTANQLNALVMNLILPASIIKAFQTDLTPDVIQSSIMILLLSIVIQIVAVPMGKLIWKKVKDPQKRLNLEYGTIANNAGTMGMVVAQAAFGETGVLYASIYMIPVRIMMWLFGITMYAGKEQNDRKSLFKKVFLHPCLVAIYIGVALMLLGMNGIGLPGFLQKTLNSLASCNTAMIMIVIGTILSEIHLHEVFDKLTTIYSVARLILIPAATMLVLKLLPIPALPVSICILETAMPAPLTMALLAQKYRQNEQFASRMVFVSTLMSMITLPIWTWIFSLPFMS